MKKNKKSLEFKFERTIPASPGEVFDAWFDAKVPGNPWNIADKYILNPKVDGLFYWATQGCSHYGRFMEVKRPARIKHSWVSPNTLGEESTVVVTFKKKGKETLMTLTHSGLPNTEEGKGHQDGWNYFLGIFPEQFVKAPRKKK